MVPADLVAAIDFDFRYAVEGIPRILTGRPRRGQRVAVDEANAVAQPGLIGPDKVLGLSVDTVTAAAKVDPTIVDYVGIGPIFATPTKPDHGPALGLDGLACLVAAAPVPAVAIGGLKRDHAASILSSGAAGLAAISAICGHADPEEAARQFATAVARWRDSGARRRSRS